MNDRRFYPFRARKTNIERDPKILREPHDGRDPKCVREPDQTRSPGIDVRAPGELFAKIAGLDYAPRNEAQFTTWLKEDFRSAGFEPVHVLFSKGSDPGLPDLICAREAPIWGPERLIIAELKMPGRRCTVEQWWWLRFWARREPEVYVWQPKDIQEIYRILAARAPIGSSSDTHIANMGDDHRLAPRLPTKAVNVRIGGRSTRR